MSNNTFNNDLVTDVVYFSYDSYFNDIFQLEALENTNLHHSKLIYNNKHRKLPDCAAFTTTIIC